MCENLMPLQAVLKSSKENRGGFVEVPAWRTAPARAHQGARQAMHSANTSWCWSDRIISADVVALGMPVGGGGVGGVEGEPSARSSFAMAPASARLSLFLGNAPRSRAPLGPAVLHQQIRPHQIPLSNDVRVGPLSVPFFKKVHVCIVCRVACPFSTLGRHLPCNLK